ncbi:Bacterial type II secretion system protein F domain protein [Roseovarius albus]|uniref:Bacterial type II secretion system protein F domain protein n=1 Tax=Roseovarius albus TaxID=1247867 RepID=A0A1X7A8Z4_9RHOB|nr:type II secretion system F family protein [Roseovarius albus]SLN73338.1 Bacterial type II secretion system protein F domain protein [Roseovarius albus]
MQDIFQDQELIYLLYSGLAVGILLVVTSAIQMLSRRESRGEAKSRRLKLIADGATPEQLLALLKPPPKSGLLGKLPFIADFPRTMLRAGLTIKPSSFFMLCSAAVIVILIIALNKTDPVRAVLFAFGLGLFLPIILVRDRAGKQAEKLVHQLPDALELMARGLHVGHPLNTSIGAVAREMQDPIGTEFGIVYDQINFGDDLTDAMQEFAERVDLEDVSYLSASIGIQHGTGGDLASVVQTLAGVIRSRIALRRKIQAVSSEGRLTAWFLSALPVVIFGYTMSTTPSYYRGVSNDPLFMPMALAIVGFTVLNFLILRKLVNFRI